MTIVGLEPLLFLNYTSSFFLPLQSPLAIPRDLDNSCYGAVPIHLERNCPVHCAGSVTDRS